MLWFEGGGDCMYAVVGGGETEGGRKKTRR